MFCLCLPNGNVCSMLIQQSSESYIEGFYGIFQYFSEPVLWSISIGDPIFTLLTKSLLKFIEIQFLV